VLEHELLELHEAETSPVESRLRVEVLVSARVGEEVGIGLAIVEGWLGEISDVDLFRTHEILPTVLTVREWLTQHVSSSRPT